MEVRTTTPNIELAKEISRKAVESRLSACSQVVPIHSYYHWKGVMEEEDEMLISMKTTSLRYKDLVSMIKEMHPYEVPEIWIIRNVEGSRDYLEWISDAAGHESESWKD
jgi:periplasmic divalent cation tolerance protein